MLMTSGAAGAPLIVTTTDDSGAGSLRQAISAAPSGGSIEFNIPTSDPRYNASSGFFFITLAGGELAIARDLTITGPTKAKIQISGDNSSRVLNIVAGTVSISNLNLVSGQVTGTPGTPGPPGGNGGPGGPAAGGGILNAGTLTLTDCYIGGNNATGGVGGSANTATGGGFAGAGGPGRGGAISNSGSLTLVRCIVAINQAYGGAGGTGDNGLAGVFGGNGGAATGGAIYNLGTLSLIETTLDGGLAYGGKGGNGSPSGGAGGSGSGGGIFNAGALTFINSTVTNNAASGNSGGTASGTAGNGGAGSGGNLFQVNGAGISAPQNVIMALGSVFAGAGGAAQSGGTPGTNGTATGPDVAGSVSSQGHNLIGRTDGSAGWSASDLLGGTTAGTALDPLLGPIQDNGGPTLTRRPNPGSAAIDNGDDAVLGPPLNLATDQRGYSRKIGAHVDIGAVEVGVPQVGPTFTVTNVSGHDDGGCSSDDCTFREAVNLSNATAGSNTINFAPGVTGKISPPSGLGFALTDSVTINGPGARNLAIDGGNSGRLFQVTSPGVTISGLSIANGRHTNEDGGAIHNAGGLTLIDCTINNSNAIRNGGGAYNATGATLTIVRCTFTGNLAGQFGGGVYSEGKFAATNSTFVVNTALRGGGIISRGVGTFTLRNCTLAQNIAQDSSTAPGSGGGGIWAEGGVQQHFAGNNIIANNTAMNDPDIRGNYTTEGNNLIGKVGDATGFDSVKGDKIGTVAAPLLAQFGSYGNNGGPTDTYSLLSNSPAINAGNDTNAPGADQRGYARWGVSDIGAFEFKGVPPTLANVSTRLPVGIGDNALFAGFIVTGTQPKKVIIRALGPSVPVPGPLQNPTLDLYSGSTLLESNDNWGDSQNRQAIIDSTIQPPNSLESAIVRSVPPGNYTAIERGVNNGTGIGVIDVYDLDISADSKLANIATRGLVQTGDNVLFAGTIVVGQTFQRVIIRALGPSTGVPGAMADPTLELHDGNGAILEANDNWIDSPNKRAIIDSTIPPPNTLEPAIVYTLTPATYTAIVRGANNSTGIAVVEVYVLQ
ncbi:MAG: hypothetical protein QOH88_3303 [Verrucomicrobiota bacterium]